MWTALAKEGGRGECAYHDEQKTTRRSYISRKFNSDRPAFPTSGFLISDSMMQIFDFARIPETEFVLFSELWKAVVPFTSVISFTSYAYNISIKIGRMILTREAVIPMATRNTNFVWSLWSDSVQWFESNALVPTYINRLLSVVKSLAFLLSIFVLITGWWYEYEPSCKEYEFEFDYDLSS